MVGATSRLRRRGRGHVRRLNRSTSRRWQGYVLDGPMAKRFIHLLVSPGFMPGSEQTNPQAAYSARGVAEQQLGKGPNSALDNRGPSAIPANLGGGSATGAPTRVIRHNQLEMESSKQYTTSSAYNMFFMDATKLAGAELLFKTWAPPKVNFFHVRCTAPKNLDRGKKKTPWPAGERQLLPVRSSSRNNRTPHFYLPIS